MWCYHLMMTVNQTESTGVSTCAWAESAQARRSILRSVVAAAISIPKPWLPCGLSAGQMATESCHHCIATCSGLHPTDQPWGSGADTGLTKGFSDLTIVRMDPSKTKYAPYCPVTPPYSAPGKMHIWVLTVIFLPLCFTFFLSQHFPGLIFGNG